MIIVTALLITFSIAVFARLFFLMGDLITKTIIKRTIRKYIIPTLKDKGFIYLGYEFDSLSQSKNFNDGNSRRDFSLRMSRIPRIPIYIIIKYKSGEEERTVVARIDNTALIIRKVVYNNPL